MATIDCTLDSFMIPGVASYANAFGTKKATNEGLSTAECIDATAMPFTRQRPFTVTESSSTTEVQANSVFKVTASGATLTIADAAFDGCTAIVINASSGSITVKGGASGLNGSTTGVSLASKAVLSLVYCSGWYTVTATGGGGSQKAYSSLETGGAGTIGGNLSASGTLSVTGAATLKSSLSVAGESTLTGDAAAKGNLSVAGDATVTGAVVAGIGSGYTTSDSLLQKSWKAWESAGDALSTSGHQMVVLLLGQVPDPTSSSSTDGPAGQSAMWLCSGEVMAGYNNTSSDAASFVRYRFAAGSGWSYKSAWYEGALTQGQSNINRHTCTASVKVFKYGGVWRLGIAVYGLARYCRYIRVDEALNLPSDALKWVEYAWHSGYNGAQSAQTIYNEEIYESIQNPPAAWARGGYIQLPLTAPEKYTYNASHYATALEDDPQWNDGLIWLTQ